MLVYFQTKAGADKNRNQSSSPTRDEGTLDTREVVRCGSEVADDAADDEGTWSDAADAADGIVEEVGAASEPALEGFCSFPALPGLCWEAEAAAAASASSLPPPASDIMEAEREEEEDEKKRETTNAASQKRARFLLSLFFALGWPLATCSLCPCHEVTRKACRPFSLALEKRERVGRDTRARQNARRIELCVSSRKKRSKFSAQTFFLFLPQHSRRRPVEEREFRWRLRRARLRGSGGSLGSLSSPPELLLA